MPYADPEKQRAAKAAWFRKKYGDAAFAAKEAKRKAAWLQTDRGRELDNQRSRLRRAAKVIPERWLRVT